MSPEDYSLESLLNRFTDHSKRYCIESEERRQKWVENDPTGDLPDHMRPEEFFNFCEAMVTVMKELIALKEVVENASDAKISAGS